MTTEIYLIANIFELLAKLLYLKKILDVKVSGWRLILVWIGLFTVDEIAAAYVNVPTKIALYYALMFAGIFWLYEGSLKKKLISMLVLSAFQLVSEILANWLILFAGGSMQEEKSYTIGYVIAKIIFFVIVRIAIIFSRRKTEYNIGINSFVSIVLLPVLTSLLIFLFVSVNGFGTGHPYYELFFYSIILVINYLTVIQYDDVQNMLYLDSKNRFLEEQKNYYIQQFEQTKKLWDMINDLRHNLKNEYVTESILFDNGEYEKIKERYHSKICDLEDAKLFSQSGNMYIDAIVNYKMSLIAEMGADFACKVIVPSGIEIKADDVVLVLGNLLDNVRDAFDNPSLTNKTGSLEIAYEKSLLYINVENTYEGARKQDHRKEYITTKSDKSFHGVGMRAIKSVVEKYDGNVLIREEGNMFIVKIILKL